jgi:hypothetical protein
MTVALRCSGGAAMAQLRNVKRGTFQLALYRRDFLILGSDTAAVENMKTTAGNMSKIISHDTLPLAIAIGGMAEFAAGGVTRYVKHLLLSEFPTWGMQGGVSPGALYDWARTTLLPLVQGSYEADAPGDQIVSLWLGRYRDGQASSARIVVSHEGVNFCKGMTNSSYVVPTDTLHQWASDRISNPTEDWFGESITDPLACASHAKKLIEDAIAAEKDLAIGPAQCGGDAEVVMVDSQGARFIFKAPGTARTGA